MSRTVFSLMIALIVRGASTFPGTLHLDKHADTGLHHNIDLTYDSIADSHFLQDDFMTASSQYYNNRVTLPPPIKATTYGLPKPVYVPKNYQPVFYQTPTSASRRVITNEYYPLHEMNYDAGHSKSSILRSGHGSVTNIIPLEQTSGYDVPKLPTHMPSQDHTNSYFVPEQWDTRTNLDQVRMHLEEFQGANLYTKISVSTPEQFTDEIQAVLIEPYRGVSEASVHSRLENGPTREGIHKSKEDSATRGKPPPHYTFSNPSDSTPRTTASLPSRWIPINAPDDSVPARAYDITPPDLSRDNNSHLSDGIALHVDHNIRPSGDSNSAYKGKSEEVVSAVVMVKQR